VPTAEPREPPPVPDAAPSADTPPPPEPGRAEGRLLLEGRSAESIIDPTLEPSWSPNARAVQSKWEDDGTFRFEELTPGTYSLVLTLWNAFPGQHRVPGIVVRAGETTRVELPPLEELWLDLRFTVLDEGGAPVRGVMLGWRRSSGERFRVPTPQKDPQGRWRLWSFLAPVPEVRVSAEGFHTAYLSEVRADARVLLHLGPPVRLVLSAGLPRLDEGWSLFARLEADVMHEHMADFDALGTASLRVSDPGEYRVALWLRHPEVGGFRSVSGLAWRITVADLDVEQAFRSPEFTREFLDDLERLQALAKDR